MKGLFISLIVVVAIGCGYNSFDTPKRTAQQTPAPNTTIRELTELYVDAPVKMSKDYVITGVVTTSDAENNFSRSFIIDDGTGAVEVMAGLYNISNIYPLGSTVVVRCLDLAIAPRAKVMQLGYIGRTSVGYIGYRLELNRHVSRVEGAKVEPSVRKMTLSALTDSDCGRLVRVDGLRSNLSGEWGDRHPVTNEPIVTYRLFSDSNGNTIGVVVLPNARFARKSMPQGVVSITGILQTIKDGVIKKEYGLKVRGENDVVLD